VARPLIEGPVGGAEMPITDGLSRSRAELCRPGSAAESAIDHGVSVIPAAIVGEAIRASRSPTITSADLHAEAADNDSALIALGKQFEEIAGRVQKLQNSPSPDDHLEQIEAMLGRLEPVEGAVMAMPARTVAGLGVKARHAAYVMSDYWNAPIDRIDWDARAVRLLIEAVCKVAQVPLPFGGAAGDIET
jgi:hypothetical protein